MSLWNRRTSNASTMIRTPGKPARPPMTLSPTMAAANASVGLGGNDNDAAGTEIQSFHSANVRPANSVVNHFYRFAKPVQGWFTKGGQRTRQRKNKKNKQKNKKSMRRRI